MNNIASFCCYYVYNRDLHYLDKSVDVQLSVCNKQIKHNYLSRVVASFISYEIRLDCLRMKSIFLLLFGCSLMMSTLAGTYYSDVLLN